MKTISYSDMEGHPVSLDTLCRKDPGWAASRIRTMTEHMQRIADGEFCTVECGYTVHHAGESFVKPCKHAACAKEGLGK